MGYGDLILISHLITEKSKLLSDISARLWFTYRRKFSPIGRYMICYTVLSFLYIACLKFSVSSHYD